LREEAADLSAGDEEEACRAGVSRTSLRNWELFILGVGVAWVVHELRMMAMAGCFLQGSSLAELFFSALCWARLASEACKRAGWLGHFYQTFHSGLKIYPNYSCELFFWINKRFACYLIVEFA
jgi:hypothetical protein